MSVGSPERILTAFLRFQFVHTMENQLYKHTRCTKCVHFTLWAILSMVRVEVIVDSDSTNQQHIYQSLGWRACSLDRNQEESNWQSNFYGGILVVPLYVDHNPLAALNIQLGDHIED